MSLSRVFRNPDNSVRVMRPNPRLRNEGESETDFVARVCGADQQKDPTLAGLPFNDVDSVTLPPRTRPDAQGDECNCRDGWRWNGTAVVIDDAQLPPNWGPLMKRIAGVIPPMRRAVLADFIAALKQAVEDRDIAFFQALYDRLKTAQAGATPPLTQAQFDAVKLTIQEKKVPIVL